jgi:hypothetical protein
MNDENQPRHLLWSPKYLYPSKYVIGLDLLVCWDLLVVCNTSRENWGKKKVWQSISSSDYSVLDFLLQSQIKMLY